MKYYRRLSRYGFLLACLFLWVIKGYGQSFTLPDILSFPYPEAPVFAPEHPRMAWVVYQNGMRNIWMAEAPDFEPQQLTSYTEDDGQALSGLTFTPDGNQLLFVRGGNPNRRGEYPNPTSNPRGARQEIWLLDLSSRTLKRIAEGRNPVVSPDGQLVLFQRGSQIYRAYLTDDSLNIAPLFKARGRNTSPRFSPDGRYVAFVSNRGDHSFIGVFDRKAEHIRWIAPSVDRDMLPVWSPDGKHLAFIRQPGFKKGESFNLMDGYPFSVLVASLETGEARTLWKSPGRDGGFAQYYPSHPLRWLPNNRLLFYSEHEGWMHIYSLSPQGGEPIDLTPGRAEAEHSAISPDGKVLYFSGNHEDIDRRHLWQVATTGGTPQPITSGKGIETEPVISPDGEWLAFRAATARRPQAIKVYHLKSQKSQTIYPQTLPDAFPEQALVEPQQIIFRSTDGWLIHGQLFMPPEARPDGQHPAVIFMHGGPIRQMLLGWHYRGYYAKAYAMNQYLASQGYIVLSVNYRAGIGYGRNFRLAPEQGPRGASEYRDIVAAGLYLRRLPQVHPARIGLWGGSYGGYLTAMGLARDSDLFAAGVDLHGVHDWAFRATDFSPGGGWGISKQQDKLMKAWLSSPVSSLDSWTSPVLLIHGDDDRNVLFQQTTDLAQRLRERNVTVETLVFPDEVHSFLLHRNWLKAYQQAAAFFNRFLKAQEN